MNVTRQDSIVVEPAETNTWAAGKSLKQTHAVLALFSDKAWVVSRPDVLTGESASRMRAASPVPPGESLYIPLLSSLTCFSRCFFSFFRAQVAFTLRYSWNTEANKKKDPFGNTILRTRCLQWSILNRHPCHRWIFIERNRLNVKSGAVS